MSSWKGILSWEHEKSFKTLGPDLTVLKPE